MRIRGLYKKKKKLEKFSKWTIKPSENFYKLGGRFILIKYCFEYKRFRETVLIKALVSNFEFPKLPSLEL